MSKVLDELERLSKAATPGPWYCDFDANGFYVIFKSNKTPNITDAELIEAMRNNIDNLITVARAASAVEKLCEDGYSDIGGFAEYDSLTRALAELERGE